ncbi:extracellular solute-binding protein [Oceanobacillus polygoni]|uniref:Multiple sugar transport system substrate-binding protein/sn-glycerol 3-phosphate transport system substrate-binding protein n=1 Tax=Oceanobacillus polygoni TaxID=1235259 RepID=A0A9X0YQK0_9BACI|nr:extracellular solute-binding protein [Oceanobacillus polygoni]MBP2076878.1 multiple sugar transport system substrate-binding protein/sn-glycerol 3-phosphate transport system substrate-binding protein [Oceanobacillus polygoni]
MKASMKLVSLLLLILLLAACGNSEASSDDTQNGEKTVVDYWHVNAETQGGQTVEELVKEFNESQDEIIVEPRYNSGMYQGLMQNLQAEAAAGNAPALVQIGWSYREYFSNNFHFIEPQEIIKNISEDEGYLEEKFLPNVLALAENNDGSQVGLPYSLSTPILYLNMDILNEAGVSPEDLTSWEAVKEAAKTISESTDNYGLYIAEAADNWNVQQLIESNDAAIINDGKAAFANEQGFEAYQLYADMITEDKSALHIGSDEGTQAFVTGDVGIAHLTIAQRKNISDNAAFEVSGVPSPAFDGEQLKVPAGGSLLAITTDDEEKQQAAWEFTKFLYEADSIAAWTEGTGYLPPTVDAVDNNDELKALMDEDTMMLSAYHQLENLVPWAPFPGGSGLQAEQLLIDMRDKILAGAPIEETMKATQEEINNLLQ